MSYSGMPVFTCFYGCDVCTHCYPGCFPSHLAPGNQALGAALDETTAAAVTVVDVVDVDVLVVAGCG